MNQVIIHDASTNQWLQFQNPFKIFNAYNIDEVLPVLEKIDEMVLKDYFAAGFISYEAAPAFDIALKVRKLTSFPLCWFGIYKSPKPIHFSNFKNKRYKIDTWTSSITQDKYERNIERIKRYILDGETYQVNYTHRLYSNFNGDTFSFFLDLMNNQQALYGAYMDTGEYTICSASPELFFKLDGQNITSRPMKGTAPRGRYRTEDEEIAEKLYHSEKNRAENIMIVDMMRNDLGRIATPGSINVTNLFDIERYPTVWQMTSTVSARTNASFSQIIASLFPGASITGAPKPRTMEIISEIETASRKIYTGCIGFVHPNRKAQFNIAIRTVLINRNSSQAEYGVGGGIVWDSNGKEEFKECQIKSRVLTDKRPEFQLLESMLWTPVDGYFLLEFHLKRLHDSAKYFDFSYNSTEIKKNLNAISKSFGDNQYKVRLLLSKNGDIVCQHELLDRLTQSKPVKLKLSHEPIDSSNPFLYHKTTHRKIYENAKKTQPDCDDVILWNERHEITETCSCNIVVRSDEHLITPPIASGLLPGTFRAWLLDQKEIEEKVIKIDQLKSCKNIYVINSVRKWRKAILV